MHWMGRILSFAISQGPDRLVLPSNALRSALNVDQ